MKKLKISHSIVSDKTSKLLKRTTAVCSIGAHSVEQLYTVSGKKEATVFSAYRNFNKCRHSFVIFGVNHHEDSLY